MSVRRLVPVLAVLLLACSAAANRAADADLVDVPDVPQASELSSEAPQEAEILPVPDAAADPGHHPDAAAPDAPVADPGADEASADAHDSVDVPADVPAGDLPTVPDVPTDLSPDLGGEVSDTASPDTAPPACPACTAYGQVQTPGTLAALPALVELSGLAASRVHPGVYYAHADSGDSARFFAFDLDGTPRGEFHLAPDPGAIDWEDVAVGPCEAGWCLYLGDIGDNPESRDGYVVYVVPEPQALDAPTPADVAWTALPFRYPGGAHNSETLLVHPLTGDVYTVLKDASGWDVFRLPVPHTPGVQAEMVPVGTVPSPGFLAVATGGDIHPCGDRVLLRSYGQLVELRLPPGQAFDQVFAVEGQAVPVGPESQGEAAAYDADGLGYVTASEGAGAALHHVTCE
jgi:hypothetical protein